MQPFSAVLLLAWSLLRSLVAAFFGLRRGPRQFLESYAKDRLPPVTADDRRVLPTFGGCIACGLCDVGEGVRIAESRGIYAGTMDLMLASSRSMPDFDVAVRSFQGMSDERLAELEKICPTRVPMRRIAQFVRSKASVMARIPEALRRSASKSGLPSGVHKAAGPASGGNVAAAPKVPSQGKTPAAPPGGSS